MALWAIIVVAVVAFLILVTVIWAVSMYNTFVRMRNNVEEAFSTMDVYLKKRYDLIPNYVETVKGYAKHEKETLTSVIAARNACVKSSTDDEKIANESAFQSVLKQLAVVIEKYPELKADRNFNELQSTLKVLEDEIASSRKYYNGTVKVFNVRVEIFPSNLIARWFKFSKKPLYEVSDEKQRENVSISFDDKEDDKKEN